MIISKNPYTGEEISSHHELNDAEIEKSIKRAHTRFKSWHQTSFSERSKLMMKAAKELKDNSREYAEVITKEMGKPITQAVAEVEKCAWVCEYYAQNAELQLQNEKIETDAKSSYVAYEPLGVVLAVMPWNYPFWQVFRFAAPALMAGNIAILKHSSNVMLSANNIQKVFEKAGFPEDCFQNLIIGSKKVENVIRNRKVKAVTLTGSGRAGSSVASIAGEEIKKSVLELGGSNALVVFKDANIAKSIETCVQARFQNTGQSCIAGKRLLLHKDIAEKFLNEFTKQVRKLKSGDPMDEETFIGVMAKESLAEDLEDQVKDSVKKSAKIILGGERDGTYFEPTIITGAREGMAIFDEETFGPAISVTEFKDEEEAINLVNSSSFGLGVSIFTEDEDFATKLIPRFEDGAVFVNELVKSDPRLPFGGTKISGYGRELSHHGIKEFTNRKTVYLNKY